MNVWRVVVVALVCFQVAQSALINFSGGIALEGSYDISNALLWVGSPPSNGDDIVINACSTSSCPSLTLNFPDGASYSSVQFVGTNLALKGSLTVTSLLNFTARAITSATITVAADAQAHFYKAANSLTITGSTFNVQGNADFNTGVWNVESSTITVGEEGTLVFNSINQFQTAQRYTPVSGNAITNAGTIIVNNKGSASTVIIADITNNGQITANNGQLLIGAADSYGVSEFPKFITSGGVTLNNATLNFATASEVTLNPTSHWSGDGNIIAGYTEDTEELLIKSTSGVAHIGVRAQLTSSTTLSGPGAFNFSYLDVSRGLNIDSTATLITVTNLVHGVLVTSGGIDWNGIVYIPEESTVSLAGYAKLGTSSANNYMQVLGTFEIQEQAEVLIDGGNYKIDRGIGEQTGFVNNNGIVRAAKGFTLNVRYVTFNNYGEIYANDTASSINIMSGGVQEGIIYLGNTPVTSNDDTSVVVAAPSVLLGGGNFLKPGSNISYSGQSWLSASGAAGCSAGLVTSPSAGCIEAGTLNVETNTKLYGLVSSRNTRLLVLPGFTLSVEHLWLYAGGIVEGNNGNIVVANAVFDLSGTDGRFIVKSIDFQVTNSAYFRSAYPLYNNNESGTVGGRMVFGQGSNITVQNSLFGSDRQGTILNNGTINLLYRNANPIWRTSLYNGINGVIKFSYTPPGQYDPKGATLESDGFIRNDGLIRFRVFSTTDYDQINTDPITNDNCVFSGNVALDFKYTPNIGDQVAFVKYPDDVEDADNINEICQGKFTLTEVTGLSAGQSVNLYYDQKGNNPSPKYIYEVRAVVCDSNNATCMAVQPPACPRCFIAPTTTGGSTTTGSTGSAGSVTTTGISGTTTDNSTFVGAGANLIPSVTVLILAFVMVYIM